MKAAAAVLWLATVAANGVEAREKKPIEPEEPRAKRELRHTSLKIDDNNRATLPEIRVAGGASTVLTFNVPLTPDGAFVADMRNLLERPIQIGRTVVLLAKKDLSEPLVLNVAVADGTMLTFKLSTDPAVVDVQVDVVVDLQSAAAPDSAPALKASLSLVRAQLDECQADSAVAGIEKIGALVLAQSLDAPLSFSRSALRGGDKQNRLLVEARWSYRLMGTTYVVLTVENRDPSKAWVIDRVEARLTGGSSTDLKVLAVQTEQGSLEPDASEKIVVAFMTPTMSERDRVTLFLYEKDGPRHVTLRGLEL